MFFKILFLVLLLSHGMMCDLTPFDDGPYQTNVVDVYFPIKDSEVLQIYYPIGSDNESFASIMFVGGLAGVVPIVAYSEFCQRIASHGLVVIGFTCLELPTDDVADVVEQTAKWIEANLTNFIPNLKIDFQRSYLMGHSSGSKIVVKLLDNNCLNYKGVILLNPVDGADPWGIINDFVITPGKFVNYTTPSLTVGDGLGTVPVNSFFPACEPVKMNFPRFYQAHYCPKYAVNATIWGHADILDPLYWEASRLICTPNQDPNANYANYRRFMSGVVVAFWQTIEGENCKYAQYILDERTYPTGIGKVATWNQCTCMCAKPMCTNRNKGSLEYPMIESC